LEDDYYFYGTKSNVLVIVTPNDFTTPDAERIFTFNAEYYYLKIIGPCDSTDTKK